jgi:AAHS family 4-hydroxybenzoate transporter-like MFS transporter
VPNAVALTSEYAPSRVRAVVVNGISAGIALGGFLAPVIASWLLPHHGWKPIFVIGGIFPIVLAIVMVFAMPESLRFLSLRRPGAAAIQKLLARVGPLTAEKKERVSLTSLFTRERWLPPVLLSVMNFCALTVALLMASWLPTILEATRLSVTASLLTASLLSAAGVIGTLLFGYIMIRRAPAMVLTFAFCGAAIGVAVFAFAGHSRPVVVLAIVLAGFFLFGCQAAVTAMAAAFYPTAIRSTGVGWVLGSGRVGSIVGPLVAGSILTSLLRDEKLFIVVAIPALIGAAAALAAYRALAIPQPAEEAEPISATSA